MTRQVEVLAAEPDHVSSVPTWWEEITDSIHLGTATHAHAHT